MNLFGASGIRRPVGTDVTAGLALSLGRALPALDASSVVIGRDSRKTGELLVDAHDVSITRTRIGDVHVTERAAESDAVFDGEPNGTWIFPDETHSPDGPLATCRLAEIVAKSRSFDALVESVETYPIRRESLEVKEKCSRMDAVRTRIRESYPNRSSTKDGVRVAFGDGWFLVRARRTDPLNRITAEGKSKATASNYFKQAKRSVRPAPRQ